MKQVYYTQCPIGYGLGATNGFQLKRIDPGYPLTGDFRHLGLRAFRPGSRVLAPPSLRYRRDGDVAEVAWLTARTHEYQTEQGRLWGRPGGQFAHGLRLEPDELKSLANWPAGLYGGAFWRTSDPERTLGQPPHPLEIDPTNLVADPRVESVRALLGDLTRDRLAVLLTLLARMVVESRCLFLIADADRLGSLVAGLTLAIPAALRPDVTFSTYNDRPEELTGFRLQGTIPEARPNRMLLAPLGAVADLVAGTFDPPTEPEPWAVSLAGWALGAEAGGFESWRRTDDRVQAVPILPALDLRWSPAWLKPLVQFEALTSSPPTPTTPAHDFAADLVVARWAATAGQLGGWLAARPASWWLAARSIAGADPTASTAFEFHARLALAAPRRTLATGGGSATDWGTAAASWLGHEGPERLQRLTLRLLERTPRDLRGAVLASLVNALPVEPAESLLRDLARDGSFDATLILPITAARYAPALADRRFADEFDVLLGRVFDQPAAVISTLEAVSAAVATIPPARDRAAEILARQLQAALDRQPESANLALRWALARPDAAEWLGPFVRDLAHDPDRAARRQTILERTPAALWPSLARTLLTVLADDAEAAETFTWTVDEVLLPIPVGERGDLEPGWPDLAVRRRSGLDLARSLYLHETRDRRLTAWLGPAHRAGGLSAESVERLRTAATFGEHLRSRRTEGLEVLSLPDVPPRQRGDVVRVVLDYLGNDLDRVVLPLLNATTNAWGAGAFEAVAEGLEGFAAAFASALEPVSSYPPSWLAAVVRLHERVETLAGRARDGEVAPDGLIAHLVGATLQAPGRTEAAVWELRRTLFRDATAWKSLGLDVARHLAGSQRAEVAQRLATWEARIERGNPVLELRLAELLLNAAPTPLLLLGVVEWTWMASRLVKLGPISAWPRGGEPPARDVRDLFARTAPMTALRPDVLRSTRRWMQYVDEASLNASDVESVELQPDDDARTVKEPRPVVRSPLVSEFGYLRWLLLDALTVVSRPGIGILDRWGTIDKWSDGQLPLNLVAHDNRLAFVAQVILALDRFDPDSGSQPRSLQKLAEFLVACGMRRSDDPAEWADWLADPATRPDDSTRNARKVLVRELRRELRESLERP
jgi:hypothetical protein